MSMITPLLLLTAAVSAAEPTPTVLNEGWPVGQRANRMVRA